MEMKKRMNPGKSGAPKLARRSFGKLNGRRNYGNNKTAIATREP